MVNSGKSKICKSSKIWKVNVIRVIKLIKLIKVTKVITVINVINIYKSSKSKSSTVRVRVRVKKAEKVKVEVETEIEVIVKVEAEIKVVVVKRGLAVVAVVDSSRQLNPSYSNRQRWLNMPCIFPLYIVPGFFLQLQTVKQSHPFCSAGLAWCADNPGEI